MRKNHGFLLLEFLVSVAIGMMILLGALGIYGGAKSLLERKAAWVVAREELQFISFYLRNVIVSANFGGCRSLTELGINFNGIYGYSSELLPAYLEGKVSKGSDVLVIGRASVEAADLDCDDKICRITTPFLAKDDSLLMLADCQHGELLKITEVASGVVLQTQLNYRYDRSVQLRKLERLTFYLAGNHGKKTKGLYYVLNYDKAQRLSSKVSKMLVRYGVAFNQSGKVSRYLSAQELTLTNQWDQVRTVMIVLTITGIEHKLYFKLRNC